MIKKRQLSTKDKRLRVLTTLGHITILNNEHKHLPHYSRLLITPDKI